jgi:hypothetical protein
MGSKLRPAGKLHILTARRVVAAKAGKHSDGGGLTLVVGDDGSDASSRSRRACLHSAALRARYLDFARRQRVDCIEPAVI